MPRSHPTLGSIHCERGSLTLERRITYSIAIVDIRPGLGGLEWCKEDITWTNTASVVDGNDQCWGSQIRSLLGEATDQ